MQRSRIATFGITIAISSSALWAAQGDAWRGTSEDERKTHPPALEASPMRPESTVAEDERAAARSARGDVPYERLAEAPVQRTPPYDARHPQTGQLIERGLFNRAGPNDFGA